MIIKMFGHYRVGEQLGRGGMGEVYLADDLNLNRKVALKFLPDAFTGDPERMARFEREAKLLASINHPNIAAIYGLEQAEGKRFIVMELVEGETLAQRIGKGALPIEEALGICHQIADGLEAAHEKGVIHRDLKPANVMITDGDKVKILDFGLAKALSDETRSVDSSQSPTITEAMTRPGVILGTAAYMSPEQAKGKSVDKCADIWAFGCILYECLTGKKIYEGETVTETLAAILRGEPDWQALPGTTPPNLRFVLRRCLEKERNRRLREAADVRIVLEESFALPPESKPIRPRASRALIVSFIVVGMIVGLGLAYLWHKSTGASQDAIQPRYSHIAAPAGMISAFHHGFALSPDGQTLIFSARTVDGRRQLWKRRLDDPHEQPLAGTDDGFYPFWSPDGREIAFYTSGELRRVPADGGQIQKICAVTSYAFGNWGDNNEILFTTMGTSRLYRVSASGGTPSKVPSIGDENVNYPQWLPSSRYFLFCRPRGNRLAQLFAASADNSQPPKLVLEFESGNSGFHFSPPGRLFYNQASALLVQRFDPKSLSVVGKAVAISGLAGTPGLSFALTAAHNETFMLARESEDDIGDPGDPLAKLKWINRRGEVAGELGPPRRYWTLRLSPNGLRAAANPSSDIWIYEAGNRGLCLTAGLDDKMAPRMVPVWSPDGMRLAYTGSNNLGLFLKSANQEGQETALLNSGSAGFFPTDWSSDGKYLLLSASTQDTGFDIWTYDFSEKSGKPWHATKFDENGARFSPDGNWIAYTTNANGHPEVWLRPFKGEGVPVLVSPGGGRHPAWRSNGAELFYLNAKDELMAVSVKDLGATPQIGEPKLLFKAALNDISDVFPPYDVAPDGQRFLVNTPEPPEPLLFIQGIDELLKRGQ